MTHPIVLAAKAAYGELTNAEAKSFFKSTALEHSMLTMFYFLEAVYWTVEAGRITRRFLDSFSTPAPEAVTIAGLLCPAQDEPPITTEAVVTNQQKLEQQIINTIKGIYDNVESNQSGNELHQEGGQDSLGLHQGSVHDIAPVVPRDIPATPQTKPPRTRKPRAASGDTGKAKAKTTSSRVPRKSGAVSQK
jgi:hypothetical protein